jgi:hypothetical protein|tara:strand:- start:1112 stop:1378 length:267 start_codon:yes stop_codon:yes gene_type:complete
MSRLTIEIERLRAQHKSDKQFLATMVKAWDLIEAEQDREIDRLKCQITRMREENQMRDERDEVAYDRRVEAAIALQDSRRDNEDYFKF